MKKFTAFIDGQAGTTGLQIRTRLLNHPDVQLLEIEPARRKDNARRRELLNEADAVFLCLPDDAAREAVSLLENPRTVVIDASTAHRTAPGWDYGFAELSPAHRERLSRSKRIANPGCHATGFIAAAYPLVALGVADADYPFCCFSLTGYSGGGRKMIEAYEDPGRSKDLNSPRQYGLNQQHKHLPEMQHVCGLNQPPAFSPIVGDYYCGMEVTTPLHTRLLCKRLGRDELQEALTKYYQGQPLIAVRGEPEGMIPAERLANSPELHLFVTGNDERINLIALFDNLGKGASGAAIQNMNIALGLNECRSLKGEY